MAQAARWSCLVLCLSVWHRLPACGEPKDTVCPMYRIACATYRGGAVKVLIGRSYASNGSTGPDGPSACSTSFDLFDGLDGNRHFRSRAVDRLRQ